MEILSLIFLAEILLSVIMLPCSLYVKKRIEVSLRLEEEYVNCGQKREGCIRVENRGWIPALNLRVRLRWQNHLSLEEGKLLVRGSCLGKGRALLSFALPVNECGNVQIFLEWVKVRDILGIFVQKKHLKQETVLTVLPVSDAAETANRGWQGGRPEADSVFFGGDRNGISQVTAYRPGDSLRDIHWKLSARYGEWMVKNYQSEEEKQAALVLTEEDWGRQERTEIEAYLGKVASVIGELEEDGWKLRVLWRAAETGSWESRKIRQEGDYERAMALIMEEIGERMKRSRTEGGKAERSKKEGGRAEKGRTEGSKTEGSETAEEGWEDAPLMPGERMVRVDKDKEMVWGEN